MFDSWQMDACHRLLPKTKNKYVANPNNHACMFLWKAHELEGHKAVAKQTRAPRRTLKATVCVDEVFLFPYFFYCALALFFIVFINTRYYTQPRGGWRNVASTTSRVAYKCPVSVMPQRHV